MEQGETYHKTLWNLTPPGRFRRRHRGGWSELHRNSRTDFRIRGEQVHGGDVECRRDRLGGDFRQLSDWKGNKENGRRARLPSAKGKKTSTSSPSRLSSQAPHGPASVRTNHPVSPAHLSNRRRYTQPTMHPSRRRSPSSRAASCRARPILPPALSFLPSPGSPCRVRGTTPTSRTTPTCA